MEVGSEDSFLCCGWGFEVEVGRLVSWKRGFGGAAFSGGFGKEDVRGGFIYCF